MCEASLSNSQSPSINALLYGLEEPLAAELHSALAASPLNIHPQSCSGLSECLSRIAPFDTTVIFSSFNASLISLIHAVSSESPPVPVVVVSRYPEIKEWLDALEAGASDYCSAPFEERQLLWILEAAVCPAN